MANPYVPVVPAPSAGDIYYRARAQGFHRVTVAGRTFGPGDQTWRRQTSDITDDHDLLLRVWLQPWEPVGNGGGVTTEDAVRTAVLKEARARGWQQIERAADLTYDERFATWRYMLEHGGLGTSPEADPLPAQERVIRRALVRADRFLILPSFEVAWRAGDAQTTYGTAYRCGRHHVILFNVNMPPHHLERVSYHEAQHVADHFAGLQLPKEESERRADEFSWAMLRRFPPGPLGWCE